MYCKSNASLYLHKYRLNEPSLITIEWTECLSEKWVSNIRRTPNRNLLVPHSGEGKAFFQFLTLSYRFAFWNTKSLTKQTSNNHHKWTWHLSTPITFDDEHFCYQLYITNDKEVTRRHDLLLCEGFLLRKTNNLRNSAKKGLRFQSKMFFITHSIIPISTKLLWISIWEIAPFICREWIRQKNGLCHSSIAFSLGIIAVKQSRSRGNRKRQPLHKIDSIDFLK